MLNKKAQTVLLVALPILLVLGTAVVLAQVLLTTNAKGVRQVFALSTSNEALFQNPSGVFEPLETMTVNLKHNSLLVIGFSA